MPNQAANQLKNIDLATLLNSKILWLGFLGVILIFVIISLILIYHWSRYTVRSKALKKIILLYFIGSAIFIAILAFSINAYTKIL